jgi:transglutaminase-like putative cysteine protease
MSPGSFSSLMLSEAVAFRASFKSRIPALGSMYWRGPVMTEFDGTTWRAAPPGPTARKSHTASPAIEYTVTVEPHGKQWLFAIDLPGEAPPRSVVTHDMQILASQPVTARVRYDMVSFIGEQYGRDERTSVLQRALHLPAGLNPKTAALAQALRNRHADERTFMQAVLAMFNQQGFFYTLSPPLLGQHAVDEFLFGTRSGFCEHYASAFAVLMRAAGVPARVVTGYLGGEFNPIGDYLIVRQADAHAWTEVWLRGEGWVRVDPTAVVAPGRVAQGSDAADAASAFGFFIRGDLPLVRHLRFAWDSIASGWNDRVLGHTFARQHALLTHVGFARADWRTLAAALFVATVLVLLALALTTLQRLRIRVTDPLQFAHAEFCRKLTRAGLPRERYEGPLDYAERVSRARPDLEPSVRRFLMLYAHTRYGPRRDGPAVRALQTLAREFNPRPPTKGRAVCVAPPGALRVSLRGEVGEAGRSSGRRFFRRLRGAVAPAGSAAQAATPEER